jgi:hypothetical protein
MPSFIYTPKGYVNLDRVELAPHTKTGRNQIIVDGKTIDDNSVDFGKMIISVSPVSGDWECISPCEEDDGSYSLISEPILAWGLTALGSLVPITPSATDGEQGTYVLRKSGDKRVWDGSSMGGYDDADIWLKKYMEDYPSTKS